MCISVKYLNQQNHLPFKSMVLNRFWSEWSMLICWSVVDRVVIWLIWIVDKDAAAWAVGCRFCKIGESITVEVQDLNAVSIKLETSNKKRNDSRRRMERSWKRFRNLSYNFELRTSKVWWSFTKNELDNEEVTTSFVLSKILITGLTSCRSPSLTNSISFNISWVFLLFFGSFSFFRDTI